MNRYRSLYVHLFLPLLTLLVASGCKSSELEVRVMGEPAMTNATRVRIYQLTGPSNFEAARFEDLFRDDDAALGSELLHKQQVQIFPDQAQTLLLSPVDDAQYIGFAADVRQPEGEAWRSLREMRDVRGRQLNVIVGSGRLQVDVR
jgi:type VI secretion system protein VasD